MLADIEMHVPSLSGAGTAVKPVRSAFLSSVWDSLLVVLLKIEVSSPVVRTISGFFLDAVLYSAPVRYYHDLLLRSEEKHKIRTPKGLCCNFVFIQRLLCKQGFVIFMLPR